MLLTDLRPNKMVKGDGQPPREAMSATKLTFDGRGTNAPVRPGHAGPGPHCLYSHLGDVPGPRILLREAQARILVTQGGRQESGAR